MPTHVAESVANAQAHSFSLTPGQPDAIDRKIIEATTAGIDLDESEKNEWHKQRSRLDADHFRGLRDEMVTDTAGTPQHVFSLASVGPHVVTLAIFLNAVQMGAAVQLQGEPADLWFACDQVFTSVFAVEMCVKLYALHWNYFRNTWNLLDGILSTCSILSNWILPLVQIHPPLGAFQVIRLIRLCRLVRLLRINKSLESLVEGMFKSMQSLGWIVVLLFIICYSFGIICVATINPDLYRGEPDFDPVYYFGDLEKSMLTLFNICILAEWPEMVRPIWAKQPAVIIFVFIPYLMLCTFGVLNLIIGVIAEQTLANSEIAKQEEATRKLRGKMKMIMRMTDEIFDGQGGELTAADFSNAVVRHPDIVDTLRACDFPRGFEVKHLHMIFDESMGGTVDKDEFVNGIFRLIFNDLNQHATTLLLQLATLRSHNKTMDLMLQEVPGRAAELMALGATQDLVDSGRDIRQQHTLPNDEPRQLVQSRETELYQDISSALEELKRESRAVLQRLECSADSMGGNFSLRDSQELPLLHGKESKTGGDLQSSLDDMKHDLLSAHESIHSELASLANSTVQPTVLNLNMEAVKALAAALTPLLTADLSGTQAMEPLANRSHERAPVKSPPRHSSGVALCFGGGQPPTPSGRTPDPASSVCMGRTFKVQRA